MTDVDGQPLLNLEHVGIDISRRIANLKINYLMEQKQTLQIQVNQLEMSNKMLKKINLQIFNGQFSDMKNVLDRNFQLQEKIGNILKQNRQLRADLFVYHQINQYNLKQQKQILESYEQKIFQMRFLIHTKQTHIQKIQERQQGKFFTPKTQRLQFLQQFILLKKVNSNLSLNNMQLKIQNNEMKNQLLKLRNYIKKSKNNQAEQFSQYYQSNIQQETKTNRTKMSIQSTVSSRNNISSGGGGGGEGLKIDWNRLEECQSNIEILMEMVKQKNRELENLKLKIQMMEENNLEKNIKIKKLIQSNNISERKRKNLHEQIKRLQRLKTKQGNQQSLYIKNIQGRNRNRKQFHVEELENRKQYWLNIQKQLSEKMFMINTEIKRSRSNSFSETTRKNQSNQMKIEEGSLLAEQQENLQEEFSRIGGIQGFNKKIYQGNKNIEMIQNIFDD